MLKIKDGQPLWLLRIGEKTTVAQDPGILPRNLLGRHFNSDEDPDVLVQKALETDKLADAAVIVRLGKTITVSNSSSLGLPATSAMEEAREKTTNELRSLFPGFEVRASN